ncbi:Group 3 truncated hemoglobin ctb [Zhongshania aliphaticivorans]|uniref:Group 3 truncated hemoglobin ctb n=1 Tax=Zhongshania aliphaticivorans TaxID=1470434 RepID=A0A5S9N9C6_9GAMM|nr:group III truncated hemoglobin [Zhongshania aliphaticivorans]CAA0078394.1 Group 3 truncated hemoglobin ctb [Zhongshania aliphaticivorans]CAA0086695.1 Group 3 truncated hemoglobin ctb [Zhongshania aliphaticivorans]
MSLPISESKKPDLDKPEHIATFVEAFYARLLKDETLAPLFTDVAAINIREHFPRIEAYWQKLLLGDRQYQRHTMNIHRQLDAKQRLTAENFDQWLMYFIEAADSGFAGENTEKAKRIATVIAGNMRKSLQIEKNSD